MMRSLSSGLVVVNDGRLSSQIVIEQIVGGDAVMVRSGSGFVRCHMVSLAP